MNPLTVTVKISAAHTGPGVTGIGSATRTKTSCRLKPWFGKENPESAGRKEESRPILKLLSWHF